MALVDLPQELFDRILEFLVDEYQALPRLAIVCRAFRAPCQRRICRTIRIIFPKNPIQCRTRITNIARIIQEAPHLAKYTKNLIHMAPFGTPSITPNPLLHSILPHLSSLKRVKLMLSSSDAVTRPLLLALAKLDLDSLDLSLGSMYPDVLVDLLPGNMKQLRLAASPTVCIGKALLPHPAFLLLEELHVVLRTTSLATMLPLGRSFPRLSRLIVELAREEDTRQTMLMLGRKGSLPQSLDVFKIVLRGDTKIKFDIPALNLHGLDVAHLILQVDHCFWSDASDIYAEITQWWAQSLDMSASVVVKRLTLDFPEAWDDIIDADLGKAFQRLDEVLSEMPMDMFSMEKLTHVGQVREIRKCFPRMVENGKLRTYCNDI